MMSPELRSCAGCRFYDAAFYDTDTGYGKSDTCEVTINLVTEGDCNQTVADTFEQILFQLSVLNNCPYRQEQKTRRTITKRETA